MSLLASSLKRQSVFHDLITASVSGGKSEPTSTIQLTARACWEPETRRAPTTAKEAAPPVMFLTPGLTPPKSISSGEIISLHVELERVIYTNNEHSQGAEINLIIISGHDYTYGSLRNMNRNKESDQRTFESLGFIKVRWIKPM